MSYTRLPGDAYAGAARVTLTFCLRMAWTLLDLDAAVTPASHARLKDPDPRASVWEDLRAVGPRAGDPATPPNRAPVDKQSTERLLKFICAALAVEPQAFAKLYRVEEWRPVQVEVIRLARDLSSGRASCEACKMKRCLVWQPAAMDIARAGDPDNHLHAIALSPWITHFPVALLNQTLVLGKLMIQCSPSVIHPII